MSCALPKLGGPCALRRFVANASVDFVTIESRARTRLLVGVTRRVMHPVASPRVRLDPQTLPRERALQSVRASLPPGHARGASAAAPAMRSGVAAC